MNLDNKTFSDLNAVKEAIREHTPLVDFVSKYVTLEQRGRHWVGLCPFHSEKTASFNVTPEPYGSEVSYFSCFGCNKSGDLFTFVMDFHSATFIEAIEIIAEIIGFNLDPYYREQTPAEKLAESMYKQVEAVAAYLHQQLLSTPTQLRFFEERSINVETLGKFKIGYCPSIAELESRFGTTILEHIEPDRESRKSVFDHNIVYPQFTAKGRIWGFYGRTNGKPKYLGTSANSPLFQGEGRLYGLHLAKQVFRRTKQPFVIFEGFNDTLAAHQANFAAIAICGTKLAADQIKALGDNAVREAVVILDGDQPGIDAMYAIAKRAHEIKTTNFKFARIPGDPDEYIADRGGDCFREVVEQSLCAIEFVVRGAYSLHGGSATAQLDFLHKISPDLLAYPRTSVSREFGIKTVAEVLDISREAVADFLEQSGEPNVPTTLRGEQVVLAEFVCNPQAWIMYPEIRASDFFFTRFKQTFELAQDIYQRGETVTPDLMAIEADSTNAGKHVIDTIEQLRKVDRGQITAFVMQVREKGDRRAAQGVVYRANSLLNDPSVKTTETLSALTDSITAVLMGVESRQIVSSGVAAEQARIQLIDKMNGIEDITGLDLGSNWYLLMQWLNGLRPDRVHLIAALSGVGKSIVGTANWAHLLSVSEEGPQVPGLIASMEMSAVENTNRILSIDSLVPHKLIDRGRFQTPEQEDMVSASVERIARAPITWMEGSQTMRDIYAQARALKARDSLAYVMIDYVQLLDLSCYNDRWSQVEKYNAASAEMMHLSKTLNVPVIAMAQLNRQAYDAEVATGEQMGSSYKIYQDCHVCYTLNPRRDGQLYGYLDKNRGGVSKVGSPLSFDSNQNTSNLIVREAPGPG